MEKGMQFKPINGIGISLLENDWGRWYASDPTLFELSRPYLEHARSVCDGESADPGQAIYQLLDDDGINSSETFSAEALAKIVYNEADGELCVVWNTPHPKYETHPPPLGASGYLTACFIKEAIHLAKTSLRAQSLRIYMQNLVNSDWATVFAANPDNKAKGEGKDALAILGNWVCIADVTKQVTLPNFSK